MLHVGLVQPVLELLRAEKQPSVAPDHFLALEKKFQEASLTWTNRSQDLLAVQWRSQRLPGLIVHGAQPTSPLTLPYAASGRLAGLVGPVLAVALELEGIRQSGCPTEV